MATTTTRIPRGLPNGLGIAIDPITVVIKECILISSSMRKLSKYSQSGVAAILGGSASDLFNDENELNKFGLSNNSSGNNNSINDPLLSGFIQLRLMLNDVTDLNNVDSLTLLQPFLLVIKSSSTTGNITSLALDSLAKFINYRIISKDSKNLVYTLTHIINSLTHCRFEASEQSSDDSVLLKVLRLLEIIISSDLGDLLADEVIYEVVQTSLSLACNRRRSDVLRKAAELSLYGITKKIFAKLDEIEPEHISYVIEDTQDFSKNQLDESIGPNEDGSIGKSSFEIKTDDSERPFGLIAIKQFLGLLISLISFENQLKHTEATKVFAFQLISSVIELSGDRFPDFPSLLNLVADPIFKHTLQVIQSVNTLPLLQSALQLFTTLSLTLGEHLQPQIELTLTSIFKVILPIEQPKDKTSTSRSGKSTPVQVHQKSGSAKELIVEEISILWTRSPTLFSQLFVNYDCNFHRHDLATQFIEFLTRLSVPESALFTTDHVPPICLEGLLSFISNLYEQTKSTSHFNDTPFHELLLTKQKKKEFITAANIFNKKPKDGLKTLAEKGFIHSADDIEDVALFFYEKSSRLNKKVLGEYLAKPSNIDLLKKFLSLFDLKGLRVDEALRILLKAFRLPGESQQIERIVETFAARYVECQGYELKPVGDDKLKSEEAHTEERAESATVTSGSAKTSVNDDEVEEPVEPDADSVFVLSYSIIMLNTDLHNPVIKEHMSLDAYKKNLRGVYKNKDFPTWYLKKIYQSIKDKEIVMPEEHHGSSQWFDDSWNNLISTNISLPKDSHSIDNFTKNDLLQFQKYLFQSTFTGISDAIFKIFEVAVDDHVITKMMTTIDQVSQISLFFDLHSFSDLLVKKLADLSTLNGTKKNSRSSNNNSSPLKLTRIKVEGGEVINISETSVAFGSDFKAQLSTVVLFRVIKRSISTIEEGWVEVLKVLLTLVKNGLIDPNILSAFQEEQNLPKLPNINPEVIISRSSTTKGLFSTFASYLKGDDEPSDEEVDSTLSALDCVKSANVSSLFDEFILTDDHKVKVINAALGLIPSELTPLNESSFEAQLFCLLELLTSLSLTIKNVGYLNKVLQVITSLLKKKSDLKLNKELVLRLLSYELLLINNHEDVKAELVIDAIEELLKFEPTVFETNGGQVTDSLINLASHKPITEVVLNSENYWKVLRIIASISGFTKQIFFSIENIVRENVTLFHEVNFMWLLGLLDEISAVGAIGGQWEHEYDALIRTGHEVTKENPYQEIVQVSLQSIKFTTSLLPLKQTLSKEETYALIQALAHQCLNPCAQIRSYALSSLEDTILQIDINEETTAKGIFELGLIPLLNEDVEKLDILSLISKVYIHFYKLDHTDNQVFLKILDVFNQYLEDPKIELELQNLIAKKKELEKNDAQEIVPEAQEGAETEKVTEAKEIKNEITDKVAETVVENTDLEVNGKAEKEEDPNAVD